MKVTFGPDEVKEIILYVLPMVEGELCIDGLQWEVSGLVGGLYKLSEVTGKPDPMSVIVREKAGQLEISADHGLKLSYLDGEIDQYTLKMKNAGHAPISQITLHNDYPLLLGWKSLTLDGTLKPSEERELKIYIRAGFLENSKKADSITSRILIRYLANAADNPHYRYKRIEHYFAVTHSFVIKDHCIRSYKNLNEYLLNIQIEKLYAKSEAFYLNELCVVGTGWRIIEKQQFTGFDKVFNTFLSLISCQNEVVPLKHKRVALGKKDNSKQVDLLTGDAEKDGPDKDTTCTEPYSNYIREYQENQARKYRQESLLVTSVEVLATWTLEAGKQVAKGVHLIPITLSSYNSSSVVVKAQPTKLDLFPLQIVHECASAITHDFSANP